MAKNYTPIPCYVETLPGIEEVAWLEIRARFPQDDFGAFLFAKDERGVVYFTHDGPLQDLFSLRTITGAFLAAAYIEKASRGYRDLRRLRERLAGSGDLGRAVNSYTRLRRRQPHTYRLVVRKYGRHEYDRNDLRQAMVRTVETLYPGWQRVQKDADVELWANLFGSSLLVGLRLRGAGPQVDEGRLPAPLAATLVLLTEPAGDDVFLDPLCEDGATLAERARSGPGRLLLGGEQTAAALAAAQENIGERVALVRWDAARLPLAASSAAKIATRFPPSPAVDGWLAEMARVLRPQGRAVVLTREYELFKDVIRRHPSLQIRGGYSTIVKGEWARIYIVEKV